MDPDVKPRVQDSVPHPDPTNEMSAEEKRALELSAEVEHEQGEKKEQIANKAEDLAG